MEKNSSLAKTDMYGWSIAVTIFLAMTVALVMAGVVLYEKHFGYLLICSIGATMTFLGFLNAATIYRESKNKMLRWLEIEHGTASKELLCMANQLNVQSLFVFDMEHNLAAAKQKRDAMKKELEDNFIKK